MKTGVIGRTGQRKFAHSRWQTRIKDFLPSVCTRTARGGIRKALKCLEQCQNVSDVVPASHERTYKDLLDVLLEDVRSLDTTLIDTCCMCSKGECDD